MKSLLVDRKHYVLGNSRMGVGHFWTMLLVLIIRIFFDPCISQDARMPGCQDAHMWDLHGVIRGHQASLPLQGSAQERQETSLATGRGYKHSSGLGAIALHRTICYIRGNTTMQLDFHQLIEYISMSL